MTAGRPKKTLKDLPKDWQEKIFNMYKEGYSDVEIAHELSLSYHTFLKLKKREKEFLQSIKGFKELSKGWWMKKGRQNIESKDFNATLWYMNMKNRFGWKDKQEHDHQHKVINITVSDKESKV